jgi:hypothetical protein
VGDAEDAQLVSPDWNGSLNDCNAVSGLGKRKQRMRGAALDYNVWFDSC